MGNGGAKYESGGDGQGFKGSGGCAAQAADSHTRRAAELGTAVSPAGSGQGRTGAREDGGTNHARESTTLLAPEAVAGAAQSGEAAVASVLGGPLGI